MDIEATKQLNDPLNEDSLAECEEAAAEMAREAGTIVQGHFGRPMDVEYKRKGERDPVTAADKESQEYLCQVISKRFPDHAIVGEEDSKGGEDPQSDFLWVLDPLDGTTNFVNGLPLYSVSVALLYKGAPVAGALMVPWAGEKTGIVLHARMDGGARLDGEPITIPDAEGPVGNRLTAIPGSFGARYRFRKGMTGRIGELRVTGSIAYELALTTLGVFQYVVLGGPRIWDMAAGALIIKEAGGEVLLRRRGSHRWIPMTSLFSSWESQTPTAKEVRRWASSMIAGNRTVAGHVAANIQRRIPLSARIARVIKRR